MIATSVLLVLMLNVVSTGCAAVQLVASVRRSMLVAAAALAGSLGLCQSAEWVVVRQDCLVLALADVACL
jgi:hypothetical protein